MNYYLAVSCLLALTASIKADDAWGGLGGVYAPGHTSADYYAYPKYAFEYAVKDPHTGDNKAQWEKRDGDVVKGAYSLVEPDGSLRVVEYWADDKSGFNAVVKRVGPNLHPTTVPVAPIYKAPIPMLGHGDAISPISIGSIAKYSGLASAPLISGPIHGGAVSSANLYKAPAVSVASVAPILPAPVIKSAPILSKEPYYPGPILSAGPYYPAPVIKSAPLYSAPLYSSLPGPFIKSGPILSGPIGAPAWKDSISLAGLGAGHWDDLGLHGKGDLGWMEKGDLGWLGKGAPLLPSWNPHLDYSMGGFKH